MRKTLKFFTILAILGFLYACGTTGPTAPKAAKTSQSQKSSASASASKNDAKSESGKSNAKSGSSGTVSNIGSAAAAGVSGFVSKKTVPFFKKNWLLLLLILGIGAAGGTGCYVINKKSKKLKPNLKKAFTALTLLATVGLIAATIHYSPRITKASAIKSPQKAAKVVEITYKKPADAWVKIETLNVRSSAADNSKILGKLKKDQRVTVIGSMGPWRKIKYKTSEGYVYSIYLKNKK